MASGDTKRGYKVVLLDRHGIQVTRTGRLPCVVTCCMPRRAFALDAAPVRLWPADAVRIEKWIASLIAYVAPDGDRLEPSTTDGVTHDLTVRMLHTGRTEYLRFPDATDLQVINFQHGEFKPSWRVQVGPDWLRELASGWLSRWLEGLGKPNHIGRSNNAVISIEVSADEFVIRFNRLSATERFSIGAELASDVGETTFVSEDLAPVLYRLCELRPAGGVILSGNQHALVCEYETTTGKFLIAVPACSPTTVRRDKSLFQYARACTT